MTANAPLPVLLIVEDDEGLQRQLKWAYDGYRVVIAGNRTNALEAVRLHEPAVITLGHFAPQLQTQHGYVGPELLHNIVALVDPQVGVDPANAVDEQHVVGRFHVGQHSPPLPDG